MSEKKAYGIKMGNTWNGYVYGECFDEDGKYLGGCSSSNNLFLEVDLSKYSKGYDYVYLGYNVPHGLRLKIWENKTPKIQDCLYV